MFAGGARTRRAAVFAWFRRCSDEIKPFKSSEGKDYNSKQGAGAWRLRNKGFAKKNLFSRQLERLRENCQTPVVARNTSEDHFKIVIINKKLRIAYLSKQFQRIGCIRRAAAPPRPIVPNRGLREEHVNIHLGKETCNKL